jgi:CRISPR-associated RAMP protein (TIGR02581 family)
MFHQFTRRIELEGELTLTTAIRIGAGRTLDPDMPDLPVVRDAFGRPYIPGSSFKGVLRSYAERLLRGVASSEDSSRELACNPLSEAKSTSLPKNATPEPFRRCIDPDEMSALKEKYQAPTERRFLDAALLERTCVACKTFGAQWLASPVQIRDMDVDTQFLSDNRFSLYELRNGVAIDRDTETASQQALYNFEVIPAGVRFKFKVLVENAEPYQLGLFFLALGAFEQGHLTLGGASSRGLGGVKLWWTGNYFDMDEHASASNQDKVDVLFKYLSKSDTNDHNLVPNDKKVQDWVDALRNRIVASESKGGK